MNISKLFYGMLFGLFGLSLNLLAADEVILFYQKEDKSYEEVSKLPTLQAGWVTAIHNSNYEKIKTSLKTLFVKKGDSYEQKCTLDEANTFEKDSERVSILKLVKVADKDYYFASLFFNAGETVFECQNNNNLFVYKSAVIPVKCGETSLFYNLATKKFMELKDGKLEDVLDKKEKKSEEERGTLYKCGKWSGILALISAGGFGIYRLWDWFNGKQLTGAPQRPTEEFRLRQAIQGQADASDTASRPVVAQRQAQVAPQAARRRP